MVYKTVTHCALLFPPRLISDPELGFERGLIGIKRESEHSSGTEIRSCSHETHIHYYHTKNTLSKNYEREIRITLMKHLSLDFASNYFFEKLKQFSKEDKNWNNFAESRNGAILCRWLPNYLTLKILQNKKMSVTQFRGEGNKNIWSLKYLISKSSEIILNSARWVCKDLTHIKYLKGESKTIFSSPLYPVIWK